MKSQSGSIVESNFICMIYKIQPIPAGVRRIRYPTRILQLFTESWSVSQSVISSIPTVLTDVPRK